MKTCSKCSTLKPPAEFHRKTKAKDGLNPSCKACVSIQTSAHYLANKSKIKAKVSAWAAENKLRVKAYSRKRYFLKKDELKASSKTWAQTNRGRRREINAKYAETHKEKIRSKNLAYIERLKQENPEALREQYRRGQAIRRSREASAGGFICQESWNAIIGLFETGVCLYCSTYGHDLTMDHWVPVSVGGKTEAGNLIPCCKSCNSKKGAMLPENWCARTGIDRSGIELILQVTKEALAA